jgi:hypothetical protein
MSSSIRDHIRSNVVGYVALFFAVTGVAWAAHTAPKNSVTSKSIRDGQVKTKDVRDGAITNPKLADGAVSAQKVAPDSLTGNQIDEFSLGQVPSAAQAGNADKLDNFDSTDLQQRVTGTCGASAAIGSVNQAGTVACTNFPTSLPPSGPAGGDLQGTFPAPTIKNSAVTTSKFGALPTAQLSGATYNFNTYICAGTNTTFPNNQPSVIEFASETYDNANLSTDYGAPGPSCYAFLVAPVAGTYIATGSVYWASNTSGDRKLSLTAGPASGTRASSEVSPAPAGHETRQSVSQVFHLSANTVVSMEGYQDSGAPLQIQDGTLSIAWIGP